MEGRRIIIGAIGGDNQPDTFAAELGAAVARAGAILLTGGQPSSAPEIKNQAMLGAVREEERGRGARARLVGVIPAPPLPRNWVGQPPQRLSARLAGASEPARLLFDSGLPHYVRNVINAVTPDVLVVFGGGAGTLAEIGFAAAVGRPLFFHAGVRRLRENLDRYFGPRAPLENVATYFGDPLREFPGLFGRDRTHMIALLNRIMAQAEDAPEVADNLVGRCIGVAGGLNLTAPTGFPGLPGDPGSKRVFEHLVRIMSS